MLLLDGLILLAQGIFVRSGSESQYLNTHYDIYLFRKSMIHTEYMLSYSGIFLIKSI